MSKAEEPPRLVGLAFDRETVTCVECATSFERTVVISRGKPLAQPPPLCGECEPEAPASETVAPPPLLEQLARSGVNTRANGECRFGNYDAKGNEVARDAAVELAEAVIASGEHDRVRGLYLAGPTGTGKTHLAVAVARKVTSARGGGSVVYDRAARLVTTLQDTYGTGGTGRLLEKRDKALLWILDDLGTEKATEDAVRLIYDLLDAREGHPTLITSNLIPPDLVTRWGGNEGWARIASRLAASNFRIVRTKGQDRRF